MQTFALAPANPTGQKNYVFVDEHNRHKRLKVMRACEGCRRRKIKCDAASTNTWPCSACTRLKLHCIPPTGGNDQEYAGSASLTDSEEPVEYSIPQGHGMNAMHSQPHSSHQYAVVPAISTTESISQYARPNIPYQLGSYPYSPDGFRDQYLVQDQAPFPTSNPMIQQSHPYYQHQPPGPVRHDSTVSSSGTEHSAAEELSEALGDLKIAEIGIAPYIRQQGRDGTEPDGPVHDIEVELPPMHNTAGSQIRIPPELMPTEEEALHFFKVFFAEVHDYVPVVIRFHFYQQWQSNKSSISPLLLEAIFACAGRMSDDPAQGAQWLALANRHEECFLDTPRLSTLQALLLLLKARESAPKRGYYYRSWMTCRTIVAMAKDLDLHEHYATHVEGGSCGSDAVECLTKTRIWQTIFICEMMVGGPQGRVDFGVDPDAVDIRPDPPCSEIDDYEASLSHRWAYFVRNARNIRLMTDAAHRVKKKKDWGLDSQIVTYNEAFSRWSDELPSDLQLSMPADGSPPWLPTHFIGNMHSHYHLGIVMLHRPQFVASQSFAADDGLRHHLSLCYNSAKILCRLQEAILEVFGLTGLLCMQRGINFTIYAILTCTMIHLIAITSPDPAFHDAREYFTRHMRVLEQCISAWPMQEVEDQINGLRVAFSANVNKPFELKASFPYGSPSEPYQSSPPFDSQYHHLQIPPNPQYDHQRQLTHPLQTLTPPISAGTSDSRTESPQYPATFEQPNSQTAPSMMIHDSVPMAEDVQWNPTPIIDQWNTAFAISPSAMAPPSSHSQSPSSNMPMLPQTPQNISPLQTSQSYAPMYSSAATQPVLQQQPHNYFSHQPPPQHYQSPISQQPTNYAASAPVFVTPKDWQQSVASVFDPGRLKRRWDYNPHEDTDGRMQKRQG